MKGLSVDIFRAACGTDCTNGGLTSKFMRAVLIGEGIPELDEPSENMPALVLVQRDLHSERLGARRTYLHAVPLALHQSGKWCMYGGNHIYCSDSRFPNDYPIKVHDRVEG